MAKKTKHIWELSGRQILRLRKEITLNSMFLSDYGNSLGVNPKEAQAYFDGYVDFLWDNAEPSFPRHAPDGAKLSIALGTDSRENLLIYHSTYDAQ